jgi:thiamine biosynthesis lipoprotein
VNTFRVPFQAMASACEVVLTANDEAGAMALARQAVDEVKRIESKYSRYLPNSIVSRINAAAGRDWIECDPETLSLLKYADTLYDTSDGLFDITSGVLRRAWNFKTPRIPSAAELAPLRALVGWKSAQRDDLRIRLPRAGMEIDFGGYGKEYAADRAAAILISQGMQHGYVNLAGDMRVIGPKPDGTPWMVGIQDPRKKDGVIATIPIERGALATSGDYERYFELDGKRYCHVIDPRTAQPVTYWSSVSVLAPVAIAAGSCSTIAMLKQADGLAFLAASGWSYLAIDQQGEMHRWAHTQDNPTEAAI